MRTVGGQRGSRRLAALLAAASLGVAACGTDGHLAAAADPTARDAIRMVFFAPGSSTYAQAVVAGARERAGELHIDLDVVDAAANAATQLGQMRDGITSGRYIGGFVLPVDPGALCDASTNLAPANNFMLVVAGVPICGRERAEGANTWAPGTLAFVSAGREVSTFTKWGDYIRRDNPGRQHVLLLVGPSVTAQSRNAEAALRAIERAHPSFAIAQVSHAALTEQAAAATIRAALAAHPETTVVASVDAALTRGAARTLGDRAGKQVRVYDVGADPGVLDLIERNRVRMTIPSYPRTMGATAVQALFDARIGRTPIPRFYAEGGHPAPALQGNRPLLFVTKDNLRRFRADRLSEY